MIICRMDTKKFMMLNDLGDANEKSVLLVRVLRKCINHVLDKPLFIISLDLILQDEEGNKVHASIPKKFISYFDNKIKETCRYKISKASFGAYADRFKYVENSHRVNLSKTTDVRLCDDFVADIHTFKFTDIDTLLAGAIVADTCTDVIGIIKDNGYAKDITKKNGTTAKLLEIDLYGSNGNKIGVGIRIPCISNANGVTKLIINQEIPEIVDFKNSLVQMIASQTSSSALLSPPTIRNRFVDEFGNDTEFSHIGEVEAITTAKKFVVCGSIIPASNYSRWYYIACKVCATTLTMENKESHEGEIDGETYLNQFKGKYKCRSMKCNGAIVNEVARFVKNNI
ncbi:uncharacterized protein LOC143618997 [Bidens hawaiensis]|uniref:uncharacterized protein LOC143618997 n=1 Tax=Bidens hawaiensis TaxID=980011 RepID=UPI00404B7D61